ncbi:MAG: hypothetical protein JXB03_10625 [Spirochaetales bacterium]|nr:hypothetical protein [Spirochaetales bacterium]
MIYVIFRPHNHAQESLVPLCLEFDKIMRQNRITLPVAWNLPPWVFQTPQQSLSTYLSRRGAEFGDLLIFPGKTGKAHHTLTVNQVKREFYQFAGDYQVPLWSGFFPYYIDLHREELIDYYKKKSPLLIEGIDKIYFSNEAGVQTFDLLLHNADTKTAARNIRKYQHKPLFLLIEPATALDLSSSVGLLKTIQQSGLTAVLPKNLSCPKPEYVTLEEILGCVLPPAVQVPTEGPEPHAWDIIANMPGAVTLEEEDMTVLFNKGNLNGILKGVDNVLPNMETRAYIEAPDSVSHLIKDSSFSFSGETERGLRDRTAFPLGNGTPPWLVIRDFYFDDRNPGLHISLWWKALKIPAATRKISLLEVPVAVTNRHCMLSYEDIHGETHTIKLAGPPRQQERKVMVLGGRRFSFFPDGEGTVPVTFSFEKPTDRALVEIWRLPKRKDTMLITFSPGGMYLPREDRSFVAAQERIDFRILPASQVK